MTDQLKPGMPHGDYERQDLSPKGILYFLLALVVGTVLCALLLSGVYAWLDHRETEQQSTMSPLITTMPEDTRHIARGYPQATFPNPKLEEDERGQLNGIRTDWNETLYSYGWVNEPSGTVRIPIGRAMDLLIQRGLPVRAETQGESGQLGMSRAGISKSETTKGETGKSTPPRKGKN